MINRQVTSNQFHVYINPEREIDEAAQEVHGLTLEFLSDKPSFESISEKFINFISDAELIIHNAPFDIGFLNMELGRIKKGIIEDYVQIITDSLVMARELRPGQRNNLDALCRYYGVDNSERNLHGALLDSLLLAEVFIGMTRGQEALEIDFNVFIGMTRGQEAFEIDFNNQEKLSIDFDKDVLKKLKVVNASQKELELHQEYLNKIKH